MTKYGKIEEKQLERYKYRLTKRIFIILPMTEEGSDTVDLYVESLTRELFGLSQVMVEDKILEIVGMLKGLELDNHETLRGDVFSTIEMVKKIGKSST